MWRYVIAERTDSRIVMMTPLPHMSNLERATHLSLILLSVVSVTLLLERRFGSHSEAPPPPQLIGKALEVPGFHWNPARMHTVLYLAANCHFCQESMPFYRQLLEADRQNPQHSPIIAVTPEDPTALRQKLRNEHVMLDGVYRVNTGMGLRGTPTILIVSGSGIVTKIFEGRLDASHEKEVAAAVGMRIATGERVRVGAAQAPH